MFKQFLDKVEGSQIYLISSLGIFLVFFILVFIMLFLMKKEHIKHMSELPLKNDEN
ncbi:hypothetical protein [Pararcticibacter amylolyticus]|uniref:hypothetical protein n=1 Tax=Pararcticibacter amylolyticus TaxID=2173175 RepID=UPI00192E45E6|nr:hypothetical protein [Pararcticibacter amylolyticus]